MDNITTAPDIPLIQYADALLLKTEQYDDQPVNLENIDMKLKLDQIDINLEEVAKSVAGEQLTLRGILDYNEHTIYLDEDENKDYRKRFSHAHEIGHFILPEHHEILYKCSEQDMRPSTSSRIEYEANRFASHLLFKGTVFRDNYANISHPTFNDIKNTAERFNVSYTATARKLVEDNPNPVGLVFIDIVEGKPLLSYTITSKDFKDQYFRRIHQISDLDQIFDDVQGRDFENPYIKPFNIELPTGVEHPMEVSFFFNHYQIMGLIIPI